MVKYEWKRDGTVTVYFKDVNSDRTVQSDLPGVVFTASRHNLNLN